MTDSSKSTGLHKLLSISKILWVEDVETDAALAERELRLNGLEFSSKRVDTEKDFIEALKTFKPDAVLCDHNLPQFNSLEAFKIFKNAGLTIPFILVTGNVSEEFAVSCLKLGIDDYVLKSNISRLPSALLNALHERELQVAVQSREKEITRQNELLEESVRIRTEELNEPRKRLESTIEQMELNASLLKISNDEMNRQKNILEEERKKSESLLRNVLPEYVALELKEKGHVTPRHFEMATVLFADLVGFSKLAKGLSAKEVIDELNYLFVGFDFILELNNLEKIKTIGDGYMAAGGIPISNSTNAADAVRAGLQMIESVKRIKKANEASGKPQWDVRVGIHTGEVVAGVIGKNKFAYDIWGATVNGASRMESAGEMGKVNVSGETYQLVKDTFRFVHRGKIEVKNMGTMDMYFCEGPLV